MLFRKKIRCCCSYCLHGTAMNDEQILCSKKGIVSEDYSCRKFEYHPCKRIPPKMKALDVEKFEEIDFSL